jgi:hypothetical protein
MGEIGTTLPFLEGLALWIMERTKQKNVIFSYNAHIIASGVFMERKHNYL